MIRTLLRFFASPARRARRRAVVEECEARVLYSADLNPALWAGGAAPSEVRLVTPEASAPAASASQLQEQAQQRRHEIVFVDAAVPDSQVLIDGVLASRGPNAAVEIVHISAGADGLKQISEVLSTERDLNAIHIISHGDAGRLQLGSAVVDTQALNSRAGLLEAWRASLTPQADVLLYGCDVAQGAVGQHFVELLAQLTGADVAASTDATGSAARGGNWVLEDHVGIIETPIAVGVAAQAQWTGLLATYTVVNTNDSGAGSLRQAILDANANPGADSIGFNIAGAGVQTISLTAALPQISGQVALDASTQPGFVGTPLIRIDGAAAGAGVDGLVFTGASDASTVRGLMITHFAHDGIVVQSGADGIVIAGNWIGTAGTGTTGVGNTNTGIESFAVGTHIGGTGAYDGNVVTNSGNDGISLAGIGVTGYVIQGNIIGLDPDGATGGGNVDVGLALLTGSGNTIGGTTAAARNLISKNYEGIEINTSNNVVQGNYIGTDVSGTLNRGNRIGDGVQLQGGSTNNLIGGTAAGAGNLIAFNALAGVDVVDGSGDAVLGNLIHSNAGLGIDLGPTGVTANDNKDLDTGANNLQNFPVLTSANANAAGTTIVGTLNSNPNTTFRIEFFGNRPSVADASNGEGERYLGFTTVTTANGNGNAAISATLANVWVNAGDRISASATVDLGSGVYGSTSEFAANITATSTGIIVVDTTSDVADGTTTSITNLGNARGADGRISLREAIIATNNTAGADTIVFNIASGGAQTIAPTSALPTLTGAVLIDGWTQPGYAARPLIELNGIGAGANVSGLTLGAGSDVSTIRGLVINRFTNEGLDIFSSSNVVAGNYIGTDASGLVKLGNNNDGIEIANGANNMIGSVTAAGRNIISGNGLGIRIAGSSASGNVIVGNYIGADSTGAASLGNTFHGVFFSSFDIAGASIGDAHDNRVGGTTAPEGNLIVNNGAGGGGWDGVSLRNSAGISGNAILGNSIYANGDLGIDLANNGVTANDAGDADTGANNLQNFPVLATARTDGAGQLIVTGALNSNASSFYRIEFFANTAQDGSGYGEGQRYLGFANVSTNASGNATISSTLTATVAAGEFISATATKSNAGFSAFTDTSEFARNVAAVASAQATITVDTTSDAADGDTTSISTLLANKGADGFVSLREALIAANNTANGVSPDKIVFDIAAALVGGAHTINVASALPTITQAVIVDGSSEPDFMAGGNPVVVLNGSGAGAGANGLTITSGGSTVKGLVINGFNGYAMYLQTGAGNLVTGNFIGTNAAGTAASANSWGIVIGNSTNNTVGGTTPADRNVISGNANDGINFVGVATGNLIQGNFIGTNAAGTLALGNGGYGIGLSSSNNTIGGTAAGAGNLISGNGGVGIGIQTGTGNPILGNSIYANAGIGIDLNQNGVTPNDAGDADTGANNLQNFPVLATARTDGAGQLSLTGSLNSNASSFYRIEFFANTAQDGTGYGEGQRYLGFANIGTDGAGNANISTTLTATVAAGEFISATATKSNAGFSAFTDTSEFGADVVATTPPVNTVPGAQTTNEDTAKVFSAANGNQISIADADAAGANNEITISVSNGSLSLAGTAGLTFTAGDGTADASMTLRGTASAINTALDGLSFSPALNYNGGATLTLATKDSVLLSLDVDSGLLGHYTFENTAALGTDTSPAAAHPGTASGATTVSDGTRGNVLGLAGAGYVQSTGLYGSPANVTLAAWVNLTSTDVSGAEVISLGNNVVLRVDQSDGTMDGIFYNGSAFVSTSYATTLAGSGWHHVAYVFDDVGNTARLYLDGAAVSTTSTIASISYTQGANSFIGKHGNGNTNFDFNGKIDEARVYNRALTAREIAALADDMAMTDTDSVAVTVAAVNDAPVNTVPAAQTVSQNTALVFSSANGNAISVGDVDAGSNPISVTLAVNNGSLTLAGVAGLSFSAGDGNADATMTFSGTVAAINTALNGLSFAPSMAFTGSALLQINTNDLGNSGSGGALTDTDAVAISVNSSTLWLSTSGNATAGSVTWTDSSIVRFGNPNLALGSGTTTGTFTPLFDIDTFAAGNVNVQGLEYVQTTISIGTVNPATLQPGDVLFSTDANETIGGLAVTNSDIVLFRPITPGNYASGNFSILLRDPGGTGNKVRDFALVEQAMTVGGTALQRGDFLLVLSSASYDKDVQLFRPTTMGSNPSGGTLSVFLDGQSSGVGISQQIKGLEFVNQTTVIGGQTLQAGQLLIALNGSDTIGTGSLAVGQYDVFSLSVTATGNGTSSALATMLFRGPDVGLSSGGENVDALALVSSASAAPVVTLAGSAIAYTENAAPLLIDASATVTDADSANFNGGAFVVELSSGGSIDDRLAIRNEGVAAGQIGISGSNVSYGGTVIGSFSGGSDGSTPLIVNLNASASLAAVQALARNLSFANVSDAPSTSARTVRVSVTDGAGGSSLPASRTINVIAVNDAPVLAGANNLVSINEDAASNPGTLVSALIAGQVSDVDNAPLSGIAVTAVDNSNGAWQYSINAGSTWIAFGTPSNSTARLLAADANTFVRFVPNANWNGTVSNGLSLRAWDQTSGTAGSTADASSNGGSTAFSSATFSSSITVTAVNDAPSLTPVNPTLATVTEDQTANAGQTVASIVGGSISDVDSAAVQGIAINALTSGNGAWQYSTDGGSTWSAIGGVSNTSALLLRASDFVRFVPDAMNATSASFSYRAWDQTSGAAGSKVDSSTNGGSSAFSISTDTASIAVTAVNDAPVLTPVAPTLTSITEDQTANAGQTVASIVGGSISDVDSGAVQGIAINALASGNGAWQYSTNGGSTWTAIGSVSNTSALLLRSSDFVRFVPDAMNATSASFSYRAWDQTSGSAGSRVDTSTNGGVTAFSSATEAADINVTAVNDAPVNTVPPTQVVNEDTTLVFSTANGNAISVADVDAGGSALQITLTVSNGTLTLGSTTGISVTSGANGSAAMSFTGTAGAINAALNGLAFAPTANFNGAALLTLVSDDQGNTGSGGALSDSDSVGITVSPVNDAPTTAPVTLVAIAEDSGTRLITQAELLANAADVDGPSLSATGLTIASGSGSLVDNGNGTWSYTPALNDDSAVSFAYSVTDGSASAVGWASLDITPVNDAPTTAPVTLVAIAEDSGTRLITQAELLANAADVDGPSLSATGLTIASGSGSLVDNGNGTWSYTPTLNDDSAVNFSYTVTDGSLSAAGSAALDITPVNDAPTTAPVTLAAIAEDSGARLITQAELLANAADVDGPSLSATGLTIASGSGSLVDNGNGTWSYTPALNDDSAVSFSYSVTDGSLTAAGSAALDITSVNDAPTTAPVTLAAIAEDSGARLITQAELLANASDVDGPSLSATGLTIASGSGTLVDNGNGTWSYTSALNDDGAVSFSYSVTDGTASTAGMASLDITPVNDAPTTTPVTLVAIAEDSGARLITQAELLANAADVDGPSLSVTGLTISAGSGTLVSNGNGTWSYTSAASDHTAVSFSYSVTDGSLSAAGNASLDITPVNHAPVAPVAPVVPVVISTPVAADSAAGLFTQASPPPAAPTLTVPAPVDLTPRPSAPTERSAHESPALGAEHGDPRDAALDPSTGTSTGTSTATDGDTDANRRANGGAGPLLSGARLRYRTDAFGAFTPVSFDALGFSGAPELISAWDDAGARGSVEAALRNVALARRSGLIEADTAHTEQVDGERSAPSTLSELLLDPVRISSVTFSAGFIWWLTRGGGLLTTMLMGIPAWRHIDLLPVLARPADEDDEDEPNRGGADADGYGDANDPDDPNDPNGPDTESETAQADEMAADIAVAGLFDRSGATPRPLRKL